jgi:hypothetical protein
MPRQRTEDAPRIEQTRQKVARRRLPPGLPVVRELPRPEYPVYVVVTRRGAVEVASDEDFCLLEAQITSVECGCGRPIFEVWATMPEMSLLLWPTDDRDRFAALKIRLRKARMAKVDREFNPPDPFASDPVPPEVRAALDEQQFAPEYHPGYTIREAREDFEAVRNASELERKYKAATGQLPGPPGVEGPVVRNEKKHVIRAGPLDDANIEAIKAIFGVEYRRTTDEDPLPDVT